MRMRYGVSVVNTNFNLCSASVTRILYAISCCAGRLYKDTPLYVASVPWSFTSSFISIQLLIVVHLVSSSLDRWSCFLSVVSDPCPLGPELEWWDFAIGINEGVVLIQSWGYSYNNILISHQIIVHSRYLVVTDDDVIKWKYFPLYWPFVERIHWSPVNSLHKGQWRGALMFSLICTFNKRLNKQSWGWWI